MAGRAPDRGALERPVGRVHEEPAHHLGGKPASARAVLIQIGRAVNEHDLAVHLRFSFGARSPAKTVRMQEVWSRRADEVGLAKFAPLAAMISGGPGRPN
jgi:hypothetical protein